MNMRTPVIHRNRLSILVIAALTAVFGLIIATGAAHAADDPMAVVKDVVNRALKVLNNKSIPLRPRQEQLRQLVNENFEFTSMSRIALGYHWREINPQQRKDFTQVFTAFIQDSYLSKIQDFSVNRIDFVRENKSDSDDAEVYTSVVQPGKQPIPVNYMLRQVNGRWLVYDVTVDNISIMANYRNQFNRVINRDGFGKLMDDLRSKQQQLAAQLGIPHRN